MPVKVKFVNGNYQPGPTGPQGPQGVTGPVSTVAGPTGPGPNYSLTTNAQTGTSYTLVLADAFKTIEMNNASNNTLFVPNDSSVNFAVGTQIHVIQTGTGQTTLAPVTSSGVTIDSRGPALKLASRWATATLVKRGANLWFAFGGLTP